MVVGLTPVFYAPGLYDLKYRLIDPNDSRDFS